MKDALAKGLLGGTPGRGAPSHPGSSGLTTPVLLIAFNRPDSALSVLHAIGQARPNRLFIAADGPRRGKRSDAHLCELTRATLRSAVDWPCDVEVLFQEENLGCGLGPATAIDWFFDHVDKGIVLEDDCLPAACFFPFCEQLLEEYENDERIVSICGTNILVDWPLARYPYVFSYYGGNWGWASWRRAWRHFDLQMRHWENVSSRRRLLDVLAAPDEVAGVSAWFDSAKERARFDDYWDYQWLLARLLHGGLTIVPCKNLISNVGTGAAATHTSASSGFMHLPLHHLATPVEIDPVVAVDRAFDRENARKYGFVREASPFRRLIRRLARVRI